MTDICIYGLVCPIENKVMYVGKSADVELRLRQHMKEAIKGHESEKCKWLRSLHKLNLSPSIVILDKCIESEWPEKECYWIKHYRSINSDLKNKHPGGAGGRTKPNKEKSHYLHIRLNKEELDLMEKLKSDYGFSNISEFVVAILGYVDEKRPTFKIYYHPRTV